MLLAVLKMLSISLDETHLICQKSDPNDPGHPTHFQRWCKSYISGLEFVANELWMALSISGKSQDCIHYFLMNNSGSGQDKITIVFM